MSFRTQAIWHECPIARVRNNCTFSVLFDTPSEQTKATVTLFVLLLNYVHIRVIMTLLACRVVSWHACPCLHLYPQNPVEGHKLYWWCYKFFKWFNIIYHFLFFLFKRFHLQYSRSTRSRKGRRGGSRYRGTVVPRSRTRVWVHLHYILNSCLPLQFTLLFGILLKLFFLRFMIKCDKQRPRCHIWYHGRCVKISARRAKK